MLKIVLAGLYWSIDPAHALGHQLLSYHASIASKVVDVPDESQGSGV